ncbi:MAG TPA: Gfo/Idh/MocA family oxidoreductase [Polyangiaceae bacterium]|jgi:predicted dehydrogenase|nr:Gfo/Idh/MocA family oxidoreductase [Polyangiaceae bacterium]
MKTLNIAMVGYQFMGRTHSNAWRQVSKFFDVPFEPVLKVVCGRDEEGVKKAAPKLGWKEYSTSWQEVVARKDIDIVDICAPGDAHMPVAVAAAEAKKVVFCEKPLANTLADAEKMLDGVKRAGVLHMLCHNYRRAPALVLAKRLIDEGRLGKVDHYRGVYLQDWIVDPEFPRVWRLDKSKAGSGALGDLASHAIDIARYLVGEVAEVTGLTKTFIKERPLPGSKTRAPVDVDDAVAALLRFENGAIGTVEGSRFSTGRKNYLRFEINGRKGSIVWDLERMNELELYVEEGPDSGFRQVLVTDGKHPYISAWWPPGHIIGYEHTFTHTVYDLLKSVAEQKLPTPNFEDGVRNQRILDAIERSAASGRWEKS